MNVEDAIELAKAGLRRHDPLKDPSAHYIHPDARACLTYLPGEHGDEVTSWYAGKIWETGCLTRKGEALGHVAFGRPKGATIIVTDPLSRRIVFV